MIWSDFTIFIDAQKRWKKLFQIRRTDRRIREKQRTNTFHVRKILHMNHNAVNLISPTDCVERENVYCSVHALSSGTLRQGWKGRENGVCAWPDVVTPASICDSLPWQRRRSSSCLFLFPTELNRRFTYLFRHTDIPIFLSYRLPSPSH